MMTAQAAVAAAAAAAVVAAVAAVTVAFQTPAATSNFLLRSAAVIFSGKFTEINVDE